ncbi:hypothetical protein AAG570_004543 [Ranatra chinensis]|uniref:Sensory neuron membrane protein 2 n=1 Tax=Ranatra chinensis TaxID=642074 RepID=A0ABD0Y189_9HEMI
MYMFSVQNPDEVANGAKPRVKEIGPYVYREFREKVVLEVDDEKDTASYYQIITYKFDEELSKPLKDTDVVTIVNPVLVVRHLCNSPVHIHRTNRFTYYLQNKNTLCTL